VSYELITKGLKDLNLQRKKVLVIGAGYIAREYCKALSAMNVRDVTVISRSDKSAKECRDSFGYSCYSGGYSGNKPITTKIFDLAIIALPIHELRKTADYLVECGQNNILIEKPASLFSSELEQWSHDASQKSVRVRVAFNRLMYPNLWKLKELTNEDGGISSCTYTFTEWIHTINFDKEEKASYERWGISNSLHVISMAHSLIGLPRDLAPFQWGNLPWHPTGSKFVGSGITGDDIPFSYHADWNSAGRWGIEVMTRKNAYRLIPLEDLYICKKGSVIWEKVPFEAAFPSVKQGIAEEVAVMLSPELEKAIEMVSLQRASGYVDLMENICGYSNHK
jgi:predicted dehydrogenase